MALRSSSEDEWVLLKCIHPEIHAVHSDDDDIILSTAEIHSWNFPSLHSRLFITIKAHRNRLIASSTYFRGSLCGSFRDSSFDCLSIQWNLQFLLNLFQFIYGYTVEITSDTFLMLFEGALYFGVDGLLLNCKTWLTEVTSVKEFPSLQLNSLIDIWKFCSEQANDSFPKLCTNYLAKNFMWAVTYIGFCDIPYDLLFCCLKHPQLTVCSEKHLTDALLLWLGGNVERVTRDDCIEILQQIRFSLLPLWFATGKRSCCEFSKFFDESIQAIFSLMELPSTSPINIYGNGDVCHSRIRISEYTKQLDLSGCPQIKLGVLLLSLLPSSYDRDQLLTKTIRSSMNYEALGRNKLQIQRALPVLLIFGAVYEVDISNCPMLRLEDAIECFSRSFPSLRMLKAAYLLHFETKSLFHLVQRCPLLHYIDLTVDISPVVSSQVTIISSYPAVLSHMPRVSYAAIPSAASLYLMSTYLPSNIAKLTLEGRIDVTDHDLQTLSKVCVSLSFINLKGCTSVSDGGIAVVILECVNLHSIVVCETSFGQNSIRALCSCIPGCDRLTSAQTKGKNSTTLAYKLQKLHMGGCMGVSETCLTDLMSQAHKLSSLCLRGTDLVDNSLYSFSGSSLEMLDITCTKVSAAALAYIFHKNPGLTCLRARDCKNISKPEYSADGGVSYSQRDLYIKMGTSCQFEDIAVGWGFSYVSLDALKFSLRKLRRMTVGLGGSLGEQGLKVVAATCPLLESVTLYFQVLWDSIMVDVIILFRHLQELSLCCCLGEISFSSFQFSMPNLRKLRLERVVRLMTNNDLVSLTQNCPSLTEFSLRGCVLLNSESQMIISSGWPGLISIHLEDCGKVTANGVADLFNCYALEDLLLRHNGQGIQKNFILHAASKLPMLRKVSLDLCDAKDGDCDIPEVVDRNSLSTVKIARCKPQRCPLDLPKLKAQKTLLHKETLVIVWDSKSTIRTLVKERI
ncbi:BTB/POZ domain-containing protein FBL11 isoform X1 [Apium graveolens]|uniref:BTB/POZ domain-containing protein FBL11 isoform X1 n=2 Tax=Apium graveolens TaxID=4045 RepID=UPI003D79DC1B